MKCGSMPRPAQPNDGVEYVVQRAQFIDLFLILRAGPYLRIQLRAAIH